MNKIIRISALMLVLSFAIFIVASCSGEATTKIVGTFVSETDENGNYVKYVFTADTYRRYNVTNGTPKQNLTGSYVISDGKINLKNGGNGPSEVCSFSMDPTSITINGVKFNKA